VRVVRYNSAVFSTLGANEYEIYVVPPEFLSSRHFSELVNSTEFRGSANTTDVVLKRLNKEQCIKEYNKDFVTGRGSVIVVSTTHKSSGEILRNETSGNPHELRSDITQICIDKCQEGLSEDLGDIDHCLSKLVEEKCKLQFSLYIMIVVIFCNLAKSITMGLAVWKHKTPTLVTLGDAVSSFLEDPDKSTESMCLVTKTDILKGAWRQDQTRRVYKPVRNFWFRAASLQRWLICNFL
jgi:hypothetical protein